MKKSFTKTTDKSHFGGLFLRLLFRLFLLPRTVIKATAKQRVNRFITNSKKSDGELICVSKIRRHRQVPEIPTEAVAAAAEKGADIVYVSGEKNLRRIRGAYGRQQSLENVRR